MRILLMVVMMLASLACNKPKVISPENAAHIPPAEAAYSLSCAVLQKADLQEAMRWCSKSCEPAISSQILFLTNTAREADLMPQAPEQAGDSVRIPVKITSLKLGDDQYTGTYLVTLDASHKVIATDLTLYRADGLKVKF